MDEKSLLKQWNHMRSQIIQSQVAPALVLIGVMVLASLGVYTDAADSARYLTLGIAAITGILATISQYAAVREGEALMDAGMHKLCQSRSLTDFHLET